MTQLLSFITTITAYAPSVLIGCLLGAIVVLILQRWVSLPLKLIPWMWVLAIFSSAFLGVSQLESCYNDYQIRQTLRNLTFDEKYTLKDSITDDSLLVNPRPRSEAVMIALENKGVIYKAYTNGSGRNIYNFNQTHFDLLKKHPEWLELKQ